MTTVYVVTKGSYSGYRIVALFDSRQVADDYVALANATETWEECEVEEYALNSVLPPKVGIHTFAMRYDKQCKVCTSTDPYFQTEFRWPDSAEAEFEGVTISDGLRILNVYARSDTAAKAIKLASDAMALERAKLEGIA